MKKIKTLKYVVLVCLGMTLWVPPCYSFGFPTFDVAEVGATIKGIVSDVQSYASTVQSTISESKLLQSLGDAASAFSKFKDEAAELQRAKEKAERVQKSLERLNKLRQKLQEEMENKEDDEEAPTVPADEDAAAPEEDWDEGQWDTGEGDAADNDTDNQGANPAPTPTIDTTPQENEDLWGDGDDGAAPSTTPAPVQTTLPVLQEDVDLWGDGDGTLPAKPTLPTPVKKPGINNQPVRNAPVIQLPVAGAPAITAPAPVVTLPTVEKPAVATPTVVAPKTSAPALNNKMPPLKQRTPFQKLSTSVNYDMFSDKSSFASMSVKTGTNEDGRFLFSDIIAVKCGMDYKDAQNAENVKKCFKVWVECLHQDNAEDSQACLKEYKQAMQDQVAAALAASLGDKEYSASFDTDVADDLSNKSQALSSERDEVAYSGEVGRASQEVLNRLLYSMSSKVLQDSFLAIEHIKKEYYNEEAD